MSDLKILSQRELRETIALNVPLAYRTLAVAYFHDLLELLAREHLLVVRVDAVTYARLTAMGETRIDPAIVRTE